MSGKTINIVSGLPNCDIEEEMIMQNKPGI